jgi:hypothetical protein
MKTTVRNTLIVGVVIAGIGGSFAVGKVSASGTWKDTAISKASSGIGEAGYNKKAELIANIDSAIETKVASESDAKIKEKEALVQAQLQAYYDAKINGLVNTSVLDPEFEAIFNNILSRYQKEIDAEFAKRK